jgi:NAD(P)-dependent dehydrogenase (short-subunit alcohol dehydrogenase family)
MVRFSSFQQILLSRVQNWVTITWLVLILTLIIRQILPLLKQSNASRIINLVAIMLDITGPNLFAYGTIKHTAAGMARSMSVDLGKFGITANYL